MSERLVTLAEAARELSVPIGTLYSWVSRRRLVAVGIGADRRGLFRPEDIRVLARATRRRNPRDA